MKILTKEEEDAHYNETLKGGAVGGVAGLALGAVGVYGAAVRYPAFRQLTLPLRAFLVTSSATFGAGRNGCEFELRDIEELGFGVEIELEAILINVLCTAAIVTADHYSRSFEASRHPDEGFQDASARARAMEQAQQSRYQRFMSWGKENRYSIVGGSWVLSMALALGLTGRNPYLSTQQKLVQARVYAQGLTVAVLIATAIFEIGDRGKGEGRWETVKVIDPNDPTHKHLIDKKVHHERYAGEDQWQDMVEAEEQRLKAREEAAHEQEKRDTESGKVKPKEKEHHHKAKKVHREEEKEDHSHTKK
ncbi:MAG: hypothetical protein Q9217_000195 [Psora testacea]